MKPKRITAFLLSMVMILSLMPTFTLTVSAATTTEKNITLGTSALKGGQASNVYFGSYQQSSLGNTQPTEGKEGVDWIKSTTATYKGNGSYYSKDPIKWRVLSNEGSKLFLLSDKNLDVVQYHTDDESVTWATSTIRSWLNGYGASLNTGKENGIDYTSENFIGSAFSENEKKEIVSTTVEENIQDKVFLLSVAEALNTDYFENDDSRKAFNTVYVYGGGKNGTGDLNGTGDADLWWLRSSGYDTSNAVYVSILGRVIQAGVDVNNSHDTVRPAFNLNPASVLFTSAAKGGKNVNVGTVSNNADISTLTGNDGYKLTMEDSEHEFEITDKSKKIVDGGDTLSFAYTGANTGDNEYISAMITNEKGEVLYYGQLAEATAKSGTASLTVPTDIPAGTYTLKLFNEHINGDYKTDFSSAFSDISIKKLEGSGTATNPYLIYNLSDLEYFRDTVNGGKTYADKYFKLMADIDMSEKYGSNINGSDASWTPIGNETNPFNGNFSGGGHKIKNLYVNATSKYAGLFGYAGEDSVIQRLGVTGSVNGTESYVGGIVGYTKGEITESYNTCTVTGTKSYVGGIAGFVNRDGDNAAVTNCYNTGAITGRGSVAGIVGELRNFSSVQYCYNIGNVAATATEEYADGIGVNHTNSGRVSSNNYYLTGIVSGHDGKTKVSNASTIDKDGLKATGTFTKAGWDFTDIWIMDEERPILRNCLEETGSKKYPYTISNLAELEAFRDDVNSGNTYAGKYVKLTADIDMSEKYGEGKQSWTPIGTSDNLYYGTFDGNSHTISNLYINISDNYIGLFGNLGAAATIKNLAVEDGNIIGNFDVGGVVATANNGNIIENCSYSGTIEAEGNVGGIVGSINNRTIVKNCYSIATVNATLSTAPAGGIVGNISNNCTISNNYYLSGHLNCATTPGENSGEIETKSADEFANGEVAYLLQNGQTAENEGEPIPQVWGQTLTGDKKDSYPVLTSDADKKVYKVSFVQKDTASESGYKEVTAAYANKDCAVAKFPTEMPTPESKFVKWSQTESTDGEEFTASTSVSGDMTVYAVGKELTVASDEDDTVKLHKNKAIASGEEIDLKRFVKNKSGSTGDNFAFRVSDDSQLPDNLQLDEATGKISGTPTCSVGVYTVKFDVANNNGIALMSVETSTSGAETLTIKLDIGLEGEGTEAKPYIINNLEELEYFRDDVNSGNSYKGEYIKPADDIDNIDMSTKYSAATGTSWTPIGWYISKQFEGTFDGNGKVITGLYINNNNLSEIGLFGYIGKNGVVKKLAVEGTGITCYKRAGGIAHYNSGTIEDCYNACSVAAQAMIGGIAVVNHGTIRRCCNKADVICISSSQLDDQIGGITGYNYGTIEDCCNTGEISAASNSKIGGIVGLNNDGGKIKSCYNIGAVKGKFNVGGVVGDYKSDSVQKNCYYPDTENLVTGQSDVNNIGKTAAADFANGKVAYLLQNAQADKTTQVWGQKLTNTAAEGTASNKDDYPVLTSDAAKGVYTLEFYANNEGKDDYTLYDNNIKYVNNGDIISTFPTHTSSLFRGWSETDSGLKVATPYTFENSKDTKLYSVWWEKITFEVDNEKQTYLADTKRKITITPKLDGKETSKVTADDFEVKYYQINENMGTLESIQPVASTIAAGKYLYVIDFAPTSTAHEFSRFENKFEVTDTTLPEVDNYDNVGFMYITSGAETAQKPISFKNGDVNFTLTQTEKTYKNDLNNTNNSTITYESSDSTIAAVASDGTVTVLKPGTVTITATSTKENATPVYASYKLTIKKELTKYDFDVTVQRKTYDGTTNADISATLRNGIADDEDDIRVSITGRFADADVKPIVGGVHSAQEVDYTITGIYGTGSEKYALSSDMSGTVNAYMNKASVTFIASELTTRTFDGAPQRIEASAMANGQVFPSSNYIITYGKVNTSGNVDDYSATEPINVGTYSVKFELTEEAERNYTTQAFASEITLSIEPATQNVFFVEIEGTPEAVYYGDSYTLVSSGAMGEVTYSVPENNGILEITDGDRVKAIGTGKVTVTATSQMDGYDDKSAKKTIEVKKRILTPSATATGRTYDGTNTVDVSITLDNIRNSDEIGTNTTTGTMANADAGNGKIVYVSGIELTGDKKDYYTLSTTSLQTTVDIEKKKITGFTVSANNKKYDGTTTATATAELTVDNRILTDDIGQVEIVGSAEFDSADSGTGTVTFTASGLTGSKAHNYEFENENAKTATATAKIEPLKVDFVIGQTTFVYDKNESRTLEVTARDEKGNEFNGFVVSYEKENGSEVTELKEAGKYTATITLDEDAEDIENYYIENNSVTKEISIDKATQENLVIVGLPGTVEYKQENIYLEAKGGVESDNVTYKWESDNDKVSFDDASSAKPNVIINGAVDERVEISVTKHITDGNYSDISASVAFVPTAKSVVFEIGNLEQTYKDGKTVTVTANDRDVTEDDYTVTYNGKSTAPTDAGTYIVKVEAKGNYKGTQTEMLVINQRGLEGEGDIELVYEDGRASYVYGDTVSARATGEVTENSELTTKITYVGTGIYVAQTDAPKNAGNYTAILTASGKNYETLTVQKSFKIEKAPLTVNVKATDETKQFVERAYGVANPIFELEYSGFKNNENKDVLLSEPVATVSANASSGVGNYDIKISGGNAENYSFVYGEEVKLKIVGATGGTFKIDGIPSSIDVGTVISSLGLYYGNTKLEAEWESSDQSIASFDENGYLTAKKAGSVKITATADENYGKQTATLDLTVTKASVILGARDTVKFYNGKAQDVTIISGNPNFVPSAENIDITYTLKTNPDEHGHTNVGEYVVSFAIKDDQDYVGFGETTLVINKATVTVSADSIEKEYGEAPVYKLIVSDNVEGINSETMKELVTVTSEGAAKTANVGEYDINVSLTKTSDENCNYVVNLDANGKLNVTKAPLTVNVEDITRECGKPNPTELTYTITGFKNGETADILAGSIAPVYAETIEEEVGTQKDVVTAASTLENGNYTVEIKYVDGAGADLTITKIAVNASAGTSRASYLTVKFDKVIESDKVRFTVKDGETPVEITSVTASDDNKTYTLNGTFTVGTAYTVEIAYANDTQEITEGQTLTITPSKSSSGGGGTGGGSSAATSYTVTFETNGGSKIDSVKVDKNKTVTEPTAPTKDGFEFDGWYSDKKLTTAYDFDTKVTKAITLYAKWTEKKIDDNKDDNNNPTPSEWKNPFTDVTKADWFFDNVRYANENGLMSGTTDTTFAPNDNLTRGMLVTVLYRAEGEPAVNKSIPFADVNASQYYANAVIWAEQNGIVKGVSETEFAPDENITREQIATIIHRYAEYKGIAPTGAWAIKLDYADVAEISDYAVEGVMYCTMKNIMQGKDNNMFAPKDNATRAEIAAILNRFIESNK